MDDDARVVATNPDPRKYRVTEVCLIGGGETGYVALLKRRHSLLHAWRMRRLGLDAWNVEPVMTREMLDALVRDMADGELQAHWEGTEAVIEDASDEVWVENALVAVTVAEANRPSLRISPDRAGLYAVARSQEVGSFAWSWNEIIPPWPAGRVGAEAILELLTAPSPDYRPIQKRIRARADIRELAAAIELTDDAALRKRLCYILYRREPSDSALALPTLLTLLTDNDAELRADAADTIIAIAHREGREAARAAAPDAGQAAFRALVIEDDDYARAMLAGAVGELHHEAAIPTLIDLLQHDDELVRRTTAWSLGKLCAAEAEPALRYALETETETFAAERMRNALTAIEGREPTSKGGS